MATETNPSGAWQPGDVVKLKSGSPRLTVVSTRIDTCVVGIDEGGPHSLTAPASAFERASNRFEPPARQ